MIVSTKLEFAQAFDSFSLLNIFVSKIYKLLVGVYVLDVLKYKLLKNLRR